MTVEINKILRDIDLSIEEVVSYLPEDTSYQDFAGDKKTQRAIERCLEIIGESIENVLWIDSNIKISNQRKILSVCHQIMHDYDSVPVQAVWLICQEYLHTLKSEVESLLST